MLNLFNKDHVITINEADYADNILSSNKINYDYLVLNNTETLESFKNMSSKTISHAKDDFLILLSSENYKELQKTKCLDLDKAISFGWYDDIEHKARSNVYLHTHNKTYNELIKTNPNILFRSFQKYRSTYEPNKLSDMLWGGYSMSYHYYRNDYKLLFTNLLISKNIWSLEVESIKKLSISHLIHFSINSTESFSSDFITNNNDLHEYSILFSNTIKYLVYNDYDTIEYIEKLIEAYESENIKADLSNIIERQIKAGMSVTLKTEVGRIVKAFIGLATTEPTDLLSINPENVPQESIFLVGMLNLGNKVNNMFETPRFFKNLSEALITYRKSISINEEEFKISFTNNISNSLEDEMNEILQNKKNNTTKLDVSHIKVSISTDNDNFKSRNIKSKNVGNLRSEANIKHGTPIFVNNKKRTDDYILKDGDNIKYTKKRIKSKPRNSGIVPNNYLLIFLFKVYKFFMRILRNIFKK